MDWVQRLLAWRYLSIDFRFHFLFVNLLAFHFFFYYLLPLLIFNLSRSTNCQLTSWTTSCHFRVCLQLKLLRYNVEDTLLHKVALYPYLSLPTITTKERQSLYLSLSTNFTIFNNKELLDAVASFGRHAFHNSNRESDQELTNWRPKPCSEW